MSCRGLIGELAEVGSVEWRVPKFLSPGLGKTDWYASPTFVTGEVRWCFRLYPKWSLHAWDTASMRLVLCNYDGGPLRSFRVSVGMSGVEKRGQMEMEISGCGLHYLCPISKLMEYGLGQMPSDVIALSCVIEAVAFTGISPPSSNSADSEIAQSTNRDQSSDKRDACTQTDCNVETEVRPVGKQSSEKRGVEKLSEDFDRLLSSDEKTDVTVQVGDVEFRVHSQVLFARCPALSASLRHESVEKETSSKILIEDCPSEVFRDFLHYIYTGSVHHVTQQNAFGLFRVAHKYLADDLKQQCLEHIRDTLCVQTFCDAVKLALTHGESGLLQRTIDFATENIPLIVISAEWQNFNCEHPTKANEILIKCLGPRS